jgi:hypothetical protein
MRKILGFALVSVSSVLLSAASFREYAVKFLRLQWSAVVFPRGFSMVLTFSSVFKGLTQAPGGDLKSLGRKAVRVRPPPSAPSASSAGISLDP